MRTKTVIAPNRKAEHAPRTIAVTQAPTRRRESLPERRGCRRLGDEDPAHHHRAAEPPDPAEHLAREQNAGQRGERCFEGEHERCPRSRRPRLDPRRDEVSKRSGEHPGDEERSPHRRAARHLELAQRERDHGEADERRRHHEERQRTRVVARSEALHRSDLERLEDGVRQHECVAERRTARNAVQQEQPDNSEPDAHPENARHGRAKEDKREERREHDVQPRDEPRARNRRQLEARCLQPVGGRQQRADADAGDISRSGKRPQRPPRERCEHGRRDREAHGEEREERVQRDRVLHLHERDPQIAVTPTRARRGARRVTAPILYAPRR